MPEYTDNSAIAQAQEAAKMIAEIKQQAEQATNERIAIWAFARGLEFATEVEKLSTAHVSTANA